MQDQNNSPDLRSKEYLDLMNKLELSHALIGGTESMREEGERFLPREQAESPIDYQAKISRSFLFGALERTRDILTGEVFDKPAVLSDDTPQKIKDLSFNIDLQNRNLTRFAREFLSQSLIDGVGHILVDLPKLPRNEEGEEIRTTVEEDQVLGRRPYLVHVKAENLLGGRIENNQLVQIRIAETITEPNGLFGEKEIAQIRVLEPSKWTIYRKSDDSKTENEWVIYDSGTTGLSEIPLITYFTGKKKTWMTAKPPLQGLAELNQQHWISSSDQNNILHFTRVPLLFGRVLATDDNGKVIISPKNLIYSDSPDGSLEYVEHSGAAMESGWKDLDRIEMKMALWGLELISQERSGNITATEKAMTGAKTGSFLNACALELQDALNSAIELMCDIMNIPFTGGIEINTDFSLGLSNYDNKILLEAYRIGLIDRKTTIEELMKRGAISSEHDIDDIIALIEKDTFTSGTFGQIGEATLSGSTI
jgi:hypothetical protein